MPGAAAERRVVDGAVHVGGVLAQVVGPQVEQAGGAGLAEQALRAERVDQRREDGEHVDAHRSCQPTRPMIFHITDRDRWAASQAEGVHTGSTRGVELADEGFIHCSTAEQWPACSSGSTPACPTCVLLHIDESLLTSPLVYEQLGDAPSRSPTSTARSTSPPSCTVEPLTSAA